MDQKYSPHGEMIAAPNLYSHTLFVNPLVCLLSMHNVRKMKSSERALISDSVTGSRMLEIRYISGAIAYLWHNRQRFETL